MTDINDLFKAMEGSASTITSTLGQYGYGSMKNGLIRLGDEMFVSGKVQGYFLGIQKTFPLAFAEGFDFGMLHGFELGTKGGMKKGSLLSLTAVGIIGSTIWLVKKNRKKGKKNEIECGKNMIAVAEVVNETCIIEENQETNLDNEMMSKTKQSVSYV